MNKVDFFKTILEFSREDLQSHLYRDINKKRKLVKAVFFLKDPKETLKKNAVSHKKPIS